MTPALGVARSRLIVVERELAALLAERRGLLVLLGREDAIRQDELDWGQRLAPPIGPGKPPSCISHVESATETGEKPMLTWLVSCPGINEAPWLMSGALLSKKVKYIKAVRAATGGAMGLKEAKEGVEQCDPLRPFLIGLCRDKDLRDLLDLGAVLKHPGSTITGEST